MPVARQPRCIVNNSVTASREAVKQSGFADVGAAD